MRSWIASFMLLAVVLTASPFVSTQQKEGSPKGKQGSSSKSSNPSQSKAGKGPRAVKGYTKSRDDAKPPKTAPKPAASGAPTKAAPSAEKPSPPAGRPEDRLCSLNVADWDLAQILRILSEQTGANLVLLNNPGQKLTVRLADIKLLDMIRHICALSGLRYLKVGPTYVVAKEEQLKSGYPAEWEAEHPTPPAPEPKPPVEPIVVTHVLSYLTADKAAEVLQKVYEKDTLTVVAGPAILSPSLTGRDIAEITGIATYAAAKASEDKYTRTILLRGLPQHVAGALEVLRQLDVPRPQVVIAVTIYDIANSALKELGLTWTFSDVVVTESDPDGLKFGSFSRAAQSFTGKLRAIETRNDAKLLASPTISVLDGESAFILIGERINYPVLIGFTQANTPIFTRQTERVGIYLQLSAQVSEENKITLVLYPQVSTVTGFLEVNGASYPQISTREAQTTLRLTPGETLVMGGLLKDEEINDVQRVPLLSQIPLLGELFTRRKRTKVSSQVIIAITPSILTTDKP